VLIEHNRHKRSTLGILMSGRLAARKDMLLVNCCEIAIAQVIEAATAVLGLLAKWTVLVNNAASRPCEEHNWREVNGKTTVVCNQRLVRAEVCQRSVRDKRKERSHG
jgi:hypothetical protein